MKFKKNKFKFNSPEKYKTGEIFATDKSSSDTLISTVLSLANDIKTDITVEKAERLLQTVELGRAEIDSAIAAAQAKQPLTEKDKRLLHTASLSRAEVERALTANQQQSTQEKEIKNSTSSSISSVNVNENNLTNNADSLVSLLDSDELATHAANAKEQAPDSIFANDAEPSINKPTTQLDKIDQAIAPQSNFISPVSAAMAANSQKANSAETASDASTASSISSVTDSNSSEPSNEQIPAAMTPAEQLSAKQAAKNSDQPKGFLSRLFAPANIAFVALAFIFMTPILLINYAFGELCYIYEDGKTVAILFSKTDDYTDIFTKAGLELHSADVITEDTFGTTSHLTVTRSYDITVVADGKTISHQILGNTTAQALEQLGITLGSDDIVEPALDTVLSENETITVKRVRYEDRDVTEVVPWQNTTKPSPLIREGKTQVMNEGGERDGLAYRTYRDQYIDGKLAKSEIVEEIFEDFPWNVVTLEGKDDAIMSHVDGSKYTDVKIVDNAPEKFERVLSNAVCTAYSFKPGTWGASGMYLIQGFVAVNTNVIPYGSLLYITSPTGKFTYGWAIAADVGEAMMDGYVDIDCFFETYTESALFGKNKMNVYVVDQLTQSQLDDYIGNAGMFRSRLPQ